MVEEVKHFGAELHAEHLCYAGSFLHREVGVDKPRPDQDVAPEVAEVGDSSSRIVRHLEHRARRAAGRRDIEIANRSVEPFAYRTVVGDWANDIRPNGVSQTREPRA